MRSQRVWIKKNKKKQKKTKSLDYTTPTTPSNGATFTITMTTTNYSLKFLFCKLQKPIAASLT